MLLAEAAQDTGTLAPVVKAAGWLISAVAAIGLTWRQRAHWEPAEEDVSQGPARVGGLLSAVALALIWTLLATTGHRGTLAVTAITLAALSLLALLGYGYLIATQLYDKLIMSGPDTTRIIIIGGFRRTPAATAKLAERTDLTVQTLLADAAYDPDLVWPRPSRALAKMSFTAAYLLLTVCGTLALSTAAILLIVGH
jgi:hypothetical protein